MNRRRMRIGAAIAAGAILVALSGCSVAGNSGGSTSDSAPYMVEKKSGPLRVGFSNSFTGNSFRAQMVEEIKYAIQTTYKKDVSKFTVTDANNNVTTQIGQINDLVNSGIDILLVDAASSTALNNAIAQAHKRGVLVVSFDNTVTSKEAIGVTPNEKQFGQIGGKFLASQLKKGDTVFTLDGTAGTPANEEHVAGATEELKAAGIQIVAHANADWDEAKGQSAAANLLAAHPDVKGIYSQGGAMSLGALNVLVQRNLPLIPVTGENNNGFLKMWDKLKSSGFTSIAPETPVTMGIDALKTGIEAVHGKDPGHTVTLKVQTITQDTLSKYVRTDLSDSLWVPTTLPDSILDKLYKQ